MSHTRDILIASKVVIIESIFFFLRNLKKKVKEFYSRQYSYYLRESLISESSVQETENTWIILNTKK